MKYISLKHLKISTLVLVVCVFTLSCKKDDSVSDCDALGFNLFSLDKDRDLGAQTAAQIAATPAEYPLLDSVQYQTAYSSLRNITTKILNSGKLTHRNDFVWRTYIIKNDSVLNAFCTPGGYIYVYTGLIKYLDNEDDLAGVMGHEIAHADQRHTSKTLARQEGIDFLLSAALGNNPGTVAQELVGLKNLQYSRCHESEADSYSVKYLSGTNYKCNGAASFFQKLLATGQGGSTPAFLSTHPSPADRVQNINSMATANGCNTSTTGAISSTSYANFKSSLP